MSKYNDILKKHKFMVNLMILSLYVAFILALIIFLYMVINYGLSDKTIPSLFYALGTMIIIPSITRILLRLKYNKMSKLVNYYKKDVEKTIDYLLNDKSYNKTISILENDLIKFKNDDINIENMLYSIFLTHNHDEHMDIISHFHIKKIAKIIKNL